ncbi:MAG: T9SS type A sorting domain-containing protein [Bacteroidota bacterium]
MKRPKTQDQKLRVVHKDPVTESSLRWPVVQRLLLIPCLLILMLSQLSAQDIFLGDDMATGPQCHCLNNSTTLTDGQFLDTITVVSGLTGETWTVENTSTGAYSNTSPAPPAAPISANGQTLAEVSNGVYQIIIWHVDADGFTVDVSNGTDDLSISNTCYYPNVSFLGLPDTVCVTSNPVMLLADNGGVAGIGSFAIDGQVATVFSAQVLGEGTYEVTYTFDAFTGTPNNPNDPGCITTISKEVIVPEQPNTAVIALVNVTLGFDDCQAVITPQMVMAGDYPCIDDFIVTVFDENGFPIGNTVNGTHAGQRLNVMVMSEAGQFIGDGQIDITDVDAPTIECPPGNNMPTITNEVQLLDGSIPNTAPNFIPNNFACYNPAVAPLSGQHYYTLTEITVTETDVFTIELSMDLANGGVFGIYQGEFNTFQGICQGLVGVSEPLPAGEGYYTTVPNNVTRLHVMLMPGMPYTLLTTAFDGNQIANYQYAFYSVGNSRINGLTGVTADIQLPLYCSSIPDLINNSASVDILGSPIVSDACMLNPPVTFTDEFINGGNCGISTISRTFTVTDQSGNSSQCVQETSFPPITMEEVNLPPKTVNINCDAVFTPNEDGNPLPDLTGYPFVITAGGAFDIAPVYCNMLASYEDLPRIQVCTGTEQFVRRWTIFDDCGATDLQQFDQLIIIGDRTGPMLSCPAPDNDLDGLPDTLVYATQGSICTATLEVPLPSVTDDCSGWTVTTEVVTQIQVPILNPLGQIIGFETQANIHATIQPNASRIVTNIPVGIHFFRFIARDDCGNSNSIECPFRVEDFAIPTAVCDDLIHVALGGDGVGTLAASFVDEGSSDNCGPVSLQIRRDIDFNPTDCSDTQLITTPWAPSVDFYCCEAGDTVGVQLLVTDVVGNFNTCNSNVVIMDNTAPICLAPQPVIISCADLPQDEDLEDPTVLQGIFGMAQGIDACDGTLLTELDPQVTMQSCGLGTILRRFEASDPVGNTSSCQQLINITTSSQYEIKFPKDVVGDCAEPGADTLLINNFGCDDFAVNVTEQRYDVVQGACYKIMRTYSVINWCEYDGFSPAIEVPRNAGCFEEGGTQDVWLIREADGDTFLDIDNDPTNGFPLAGTRGTDCDGVSNPAGYWSTIDGNGSWTYLQVIKVIDTTAPTIAITNPDPVCTTPNNCEATAVVDFSLTDGCAADPPVLTIAIDELNTGTFVLGGTLTGTYPNYQVSVDLPIGTHRLRVAADDQCGNSTAETIEFSVVDCQAAGLICNDQMAVVLMAQDPGIDADGDGDFDMGAVAVNAEMFVNSAGTDCSGPLRYTIHRIDQIDSGADVPFPNRPVLVVTCDEIGFVPVRIYQWDSAFNPLAVQPDGTTGGPNYTTCDATLVVQDNQNVCTTVTAMGNVSGLIITEEGVPVAGVEVSPRDDMMEDMMMTENDGLYEFDLHTEEEYEITPYSPADYLNGVSTIDIIFISKHILGIQPLDSPYKLLAADVNKSNTVSTLDLIHLRKVILGVSQEFPNNGSWRYIDAAYNFPNPTDPWQEEFPESLEIPMLTHDLFGADFIAVKVGDVNGNAQASNLDDDEGRALGENYYLRTEERSFKAGETLEALFTAADADDLIQGFQMTLQFDPALVEVTNIEWGLIQPEHVNQSQLDRGLLTISWNAATDIYDLSMEEMNFFGLQFYAVGEGRLSESIGITSRLIKAEAYGIADEIRGLGLNFVPASKTEDGFFLEQNRPNPFGDQTIIGFQIPEAGQVYLTIYDTNGKVVQQYQQYFAAGYNQLLVDAQDIAARGLLYYKLETDQYAATKKMVILTTD